MAKVDDNPAAVVITKLRRLSYEAPGYSPDGLEWKSPQSKTPAKIRNVVRTAAATRMESMGTVTSLDLPTI
jgi:hypothetical protein